MSVMDKRTAAPAGGDETATPKRALGWLPLVAGGVGVVGALLVLLSVVGGASSRDWYRGQVGGSRLYALDVRFARVLPFVIGAAIALAVVQRGRQRVEREHGASVRRHEWSEVLTHWMNAAGIGLGIITAAWLLTWFERPVSLETVYILHFFGAGLTTAAVAHHLTFQFVGGGRGLLPRWGGDVRNALAEVVGYTGVYRGLRGVFGIQLPPAVRRPLQRLLRRLNLVPDEHGKYLATEKVLSYPVWGLLVGIVVLTGLVKTLNYVLPVPGGLRQAATFLHDGSTIFLIIFLVFHVAALVLVPRNWPLLKSMFTSRISRAYVEKHLPGWKVTDGR